MPLTFPRKTTDYFVCAYLYAHRIWTDVITEYPPVEWFRLITGLLGMASFVEQFSPYAAHSLPLPRYARTGSLRGWFDISSPLRARSYAAFRLLLSRAGLKTKTNTSVTTCVSV